MELYKLYHTCLNLFMPNGLHYLHSLGQSISKTRGICLIFLLPCFIDIPVFDANSLDPDEMPHSAVSDLGLHCLPMSLSIIKKKTFYLI